MREEPADKKKKNDNFAREELGALLRLFSALGITVAVGIAGFFFLGVYIDRKLSAMGYATRGLPRIGFLLFGLGMSIYWAYLRIARHLDKYDKGKDGEKGEDDAN